MRKAPDQGRGQGGVVQKALALGAVGYGLVQTWPLVAPGSYGPEWWIYSWGGGAALGLSLAGALAAETSALALRITRTVRAFRPKRLKGEACWLSAGEARKAGLGRTNGLFLGVLEGQPLFIPDAVHTLTCAPSRKGKTTSFVLPALCHDIGTSRLVADLRGDLVRQTAELIRTHHGHRVLALDPAHLSGEAGARYNPLQIILDDLAHAPQDAIADARSMAMQLHGDPQGGSREPFWPQGTRKMLGFLFVALSALRPEAEATLPRALDVLSDEEQFLRLLEEAKASALLGGELASLAANILATFELNPKHFESFREGAIQSLMPFGASGRLAPQVSACDFRFTDLKREKTTVFVVCDPSRMDVFAPWLGLMVWAALKELVRAGNSVPVTLLLDEFTGYPLRGLPEALTGLAAYGIHCCLIVQELEEIARVYGREALATVLSQCDVKQFFGVASQDTASMVSRMLGQHLTGTESFSLGAVPGETPGLSLGRTPRDLMRPDEIRQMPGDEQILFIRNLKPARALKLGYHEVAPWRSQVQPNPFFGGKRFLGTLKMRLRRGRAVATRAGTRKRPVPTRPVFAPLLAVLSMLMPGRAAVVLAGATLIVLSFGWPYLLVEYTRSENWCRYYSVPGITRPYTVQGRGHCPLIEWRK